MKFIQAVMDKVVIQVMSNEETTKGGIYIPQTALDNAPHRIGKVISVGKKVEDIVPGDTILFAKFGGQDTILDGIIYKVLGMGEIYGKLAETD
jgi:chaperonin GroES